MTDTAACQKFKEFHLGAKELREYSTHWKELREKRNKPPPEVKEIVLAQPPPTAPPVVPEAPAKKSTTFSDEGIF